MLENQVCKQNCSEKKNWLDKIIIKKKTKKYIVYKPLVINLGSYGNTVQYQYTS